MLTLAVGYCFGSLFLLVTPNDLSWLEAQHLSNDDRALNLPRDGCIHTNSTSSFDRINLKTEWKKT